MYGDLASFITDFLGSVHSLVKKKKLGTLCQYICIPYRLVRIRNTLYEYILTPSSFLWNMYLVFLQNLIYMSKKVIRHNAMAILCLPFLWSTQRMQLLK